MRADQRSECSYYDIKRCNEAVVMTLREYVPVFISLRCLPTADEKVNTMQPTHETRVSASVAESRSEVIILSLILNVVGPSLRVS